MFDEFGINAGYVEELHNQYLQSPQSLDPGWRAFFERRAHPGPVNGTNGAPYANGAHAPPEDDLPAASLQGRVYQLINAYRVRGHLFAHVDPLGSPSETTVDFSPANFGLAEGDLDSPFPLTDLAGLPERSTLRDIIDHLRETYCRSIGVEFTHIEETEEREWLQHTMERSRNRAPLDPPELLRILGRLTDAETLEQFIHKNYVGAKRFSLEGAESLIAMLDVLIEEAGRHAVEEIVIGMAHRGRINVLVNIMGKNVREIFAAFDDKRPERFLGAGDVKYHLGYSSDFKTRSGNNVHLSLCFNPSHLEWVNPVVSGRVRAKQDRRKRKSTMPLLIHGDAAFVGQGVVAETLNLMNLDGYSTGGTVHLVVNNQVGFTTVPRDSRSTRYCTDIARMLRVPVFHVNGEDPEAVIQVTRLAVEFRERFRKDVVIDMYCFRRYGHNEGDEPRFTQPVMYSLIDKKPSVREIYVRRLVEAGKITRKEADDIAVSRRTTLDRELEEARKGDYLQMPEAMGGVWASFTGGPEKAVTEVDTRVSEGTLLGLLEKLCQVPEGFAANPKAHKVLEQRFEKAKAGEKLDWGTGEVLAFASLLSDGRGVRLTGQDSRRGTFSHRHAVLFDSHSGRPYIPLANLSENQGRFEVHDSPLSEAGVLGFEYGYSLDRPEKLVMWEAQFGDFLNTAQVIVDQFIISAEDKWGRLSGLVLLLPHGYEGQGPEHSSARMERFLQLSAEDNIQVCNLTTAAQLFHVLRRQVLSPWRKPLILFTPKGALRRPTSTLKDIAEGSFERAIGDRSVAPEGVRRILACSGKIYWDLVEAREKRGRRDVAIVRLEQLYPISDAFLRAVTPYKPGTPLVWVQEEPRNMGPWYFMNARMREFVGDRHPWSLASRDESASPATGSHASHQMEHAMLMDQAFAGLE